MTTKRATTKRVRRLGWAALLLASLLAALSCSNLGYYSQAVWGQTRILAKRQNIANLVRDPKTPEELRRKLAAVLRIREFAVRELLLPDNGSYTAYVELGLGDDGTRRRNVVWNVVAAPELSTAPLTWCFPVAGCVAYRGYFSEARAEKFADRLGRKGYDVAVSGASAYSTLGWFKDPVLSTVIDYPEVYLAGLLFHEMAHQLLYVRDDTRFNESFATAVEIEGVRRWLGAVSPPPIPPEGAVGQDSAAMDEYLVRKRREEEFAELVLDYRERLQDAYETGESEEWRRRRKPEIFHELKEAYGELRTSWGGYDGYDGWFDRELNNAHLVLVGAYHELVPAFQKLLGESGGDLAAFYEAVREISELTPQQREARLGE